MNYVCTEYVTHVLITIKIIFGVLLHALFTLLVLWDSIHWTISLVKWHLWAILFFLTNEKLCMLKKDAFFCCFIWVAVPLSAFSWVEICQGKLALAELHLFAQMLRLTVTILVLSARSTVRSGQVAETTKAKAAQLHGTAKSVLLADDVLRAWAYTQTLVFVVFNHIRAFTITLLGLCVLPRLLRVFYAVNDIYTLFVL